MNKKVLSIVAIIALIAVMTVCLVACNANTYEKKLDKAGYKVSTLDKEDIEDAYGDDDADISWAVSGVKGLNSVTVIKYKKIADAKDFVEDMKGIPGITVERSASYVFIGTADAVAVVK